jgi:hypothetical protein
MREEEKCRNFHCKLIRHPIHGIRLSYTIPDGYDSSDGSKDYDVIPTWKMTVCGHPDRPSNIPRCTYNTHELRKFIYCILINQLFNIRFHMPSRNSKYCFYPITKTAMKP